LRSYVNFNQDDWVKCGTLWLTPLINGAPFRLMFGLDPRMDFTEIDASGVVDPNALDGAGSLKERRDQASEALVKA
jgi:hypothetical protein